MTILRRCAVILAAIFMAGCAGGLNDIGAEPTMTAVGHTPNYYSGVDPMLQRVSVAPRVNARPRYMRGSLWNSGPSSLFGDRRAQSMGDIVTIIIKISDNASINNSSNRARSGSDNLSIPNFLGIPQIINKRLPDGASLDTAVGVSSSSSATGNGSVSRAENITLRVAATVVDVLQNGHLVVQGNQEVRVNYELRDLQVAGVVRPEDISRRNEITYDKIAGARISYGGRGQISAMQQPRPGQQIADIILPY